MVYTHFCKTISKFLKGGARPYRQSLRIMEDVVEVADGPGHGSGAGLMEGERKRGERARRGGREAEPGEPQSLSCG